MLQVTEAAPLDIKIFFSDGVIHTLSLDPGPDVQISKQVSKMVVSGSAGSHIKGKVIHYVE